MLLLTKSEDNLPVPCQLTITPPNKGGISTVSVISDSKRIFDFDISIPIFIKPTNQSCFNILTYLVGVHPNGLVCPFSMANGGMWSGKIRYNNQSDRKSLQIAIDDWGHEYLFTLTDLDTEAIIITASQLSTTSDVQSISLEVDKMCMTTSANVYSLNIYPPLSPYQMALVSYFRDFSISSIEDNISVSFDDTSSDHLTYRKIGRLKYLVDDTGTHLVILTKIETLDHTVDILLDLHAEFIAKNISYSTNISNIFKNEIRRLAIPGSSVTFSIPNMHSIIPELLIKYEQGLRNIEPEDDII